IDVLSPPKAMSPNPTTGLDAVEHVVLLVLENRSYDHILGDFPGGVNKDAPGRNSDGERDYAQAPGAARILMADPKHEAQNVAMQLVNGNAGFVYDFAAAYPGSSQAERAEIMKYHARGTLPALHALADAFCICTQWFSSVPGPTWANRLFALSGTSLGRVKM